MSVSLEQFVASLSGSGLLSSDEIRRFIDGLPHGDRLTEARELSDALVAHNRLTPFQSQAVYCGKAQGLVLGNYTLVDLLGVGGMGQVFKAEHRRMKRVVALKVLADGKTKSKLALPRFQREVEAAAKLDHPNIVAAYDADESNGTHYLVMQFVDGQDLSSLVKENGPLDVSAAVDCATQIARGLQYAHSQGVIHRDIKPSNVLLDKQGCVKILDMGLARLMDGTGTGNPSAPAPANDLTGSGQIIGTVDYMSPEQALNTRYADHRSDIYSLGCTLHFLLTGKPPYTGETPMERLLAHRERSIPSLVSECPEAPPALVAIFEKMMAKAPGQRYQDVAEALGDLAAFDASHAQALAAFEWTAETAGDETAPQSADAGMAGPRVAESAAGAALVPPAIVEEPIHDLWEPLQRLRVWHWALGAATGGLLMLLAGIVFLTFFAR